MTGTANASIRFAVRWWAVAAVVVAWELVTVVGHVDAAIVPGPYTVLRRLVSSPATFGAPLGDTALTAAIGPGSRTALPHCLESCATPATAPTSLASGTLRRSTR